jgi:hypothetical protein
MLMDYGTWISFLPEKADFNKIPASYLPSIHLSIHHVSLSLHLPRLKTSNNPSPHIIQIIGK